MNAFESQFARHLAQRIKDLSEDKAGEILGGMLGSFDEYKYRSGYLRALRDMIEVAKEIENDMLGISHETGR